MQKCVKIFSGDKTMRLKELREEKNLTQQEVANAINTSQTNIGRWEKNQNEPGANHIILLANFFECSTDYLLGRSDDFGIINIQNEKIQLNKNEKEILDIFNSIPTESQAQLLEYARYCKMKSQDFNKTNNQRRA